MHPRFAIIAGIFPVMTLSNAIVPVLTRYAPDSLWQGAIYAAYFFGAFITTLPAGILSDSYGRVPVIRVGLIISAISGCGRLMPTALISTVDEPTIVQRYGHENGVSRLHKKRT